MSPSLIDSIISGLSQIGVAIVMAGAMLLFLRHLFVHMIPGERAAVVANIKKELKEEGFLPSSATLENQKAMFTALTSLVEESRQAHKEVQTSLLEILGEIRRR